MDATARRRLGEVVKGSPTARADTLVGTLFEADFESRSAKLRTSEGARVAVTFDDEQADEVYEALRERSQLVGEVTYDPRTSRALKVDLRQITLAEQLRLSLETGDFWADQSLEDLRRQHDVSPIEDPASLLAEDLTDDEAGLLLAAIES